METDRQDTQFPEPKLYPKFSGTEMTSEGKIYSGDKIATSIVMEPGAPYGNTHGDFYQVDAKGIAIGDEHMTFSSFGQLCQFYEQLGSYIQDCIEKKKAWAMYKASKE